NPEGDFSDVDGYIAVGASLLGASLSVPDKLGGPLPSGEPMESFSVRVFVDQAISIADPLDVTVEIPNASTEKNEYLLMFREQGRIDESLVLLDEDATVSIVTNQTVVNTPPVVTLPLTISAAEDAANTTLNLLQGATDADGDQLTVQNPSVSSGNPVGTSIVGNTLNVNPSAYADLLNEGDSEVIVYNYTISDGRGGTVGQTATVTITGKNDPNTPPTTSQVTSTFTEDDANAFVNLLLNANDADGDTLTVSNVVLTSTAATAIGITVDAANARLSVNPSAYGALNTGESRVATYTYDISDGNGGTAAGTASVTITGVDETGTNTNPVVGTTPLTATLTEDDAQPTVIGLLQTATDADGDTLNASGFSVVSGNDAGFSLTGNTLTVTPSAYNSLQQGASEAVVATYSIIDGNGGSVAQTLTVTISGVNDAPVVTGALARTFNESDASSTLNLLTDATDPDTGDVLSVSNPSSSGDTAGVMVTGNTLSIDPSAYASLNTGESATAVITYQIIDGNGGSVNQTATITINGQGTAGGGNNAPTVSGPITNTSTEDDAARTVNLLAGAADADGDTLSVTGLTVTGNTAGAAVNGNIVTITPAAYSALNTGESAQIVYSYTISDGNGGTVAQTATITITGITDVTNSAPVVSAPVTATFNEDAANGTVNLLAGASDADGDTLTAQAGSFSGDRSGITVSGNTLTVNPSAYGGLNTGETAVVTYTYVISDGNGGTVNQTATITITGADEIVDGQGATVKGQLFADHPIFVNGVAQPGDGIKQDNESAFAGVVVRLTPSNGVQRTTTTDLKGNYSFLNVPAGAYSVSYELPSNVLTTGSASSSGTIASGSSATVAGPSLGTVAIQGAISNLDILASSYLTANQGTSAASDGGLQGGSALLDAAGNQELFIAGLGLDGVRFAEIALNAERDAALLTVLEDDGDILTARLRRDQFLVSADGTAVQFFGGMEDFEFAASTNDLLTQEFATYRNAIDQVLSQSS
ncbi:MAG: cadherin-like domain-containing protein, partial [Pirellulaceae bacterium]